jgi:hypothetical protein
MDTKLCVSCNNTQDIDNFYKHKNGYESKCKLCKRNYSRSIRDKRKQQVKQPITEKSCADCNMLKTISFNWRNLRPCFKLDNIKKSSKIIPELINTHKQMAEEFLKINPLPSQPGDRVDGAE